MERVFRQFAAFVLLFVLAGVAAAQTTSRGTVSGTVVDPSNAVVPNADVTLTNTGTSVARHTTTNSAGFYRFDAVDLGTYNINVEAKGFAASRVTDVDVSAARVLDVPFTLRVGQASEVVEVQGAAAGITLQTSEQVRGETIEAESIEKIPVFLHDTLTLAQLAPGVAVAGGGDGTRSRNINIAGNLAFSANGQRARSNNFMIDGVENNDISISGPAYTINNPDVVQEVNVQTANFSAEFGRAGGAVINQITKSGTNALHGTARYSYTGSAFKALNYQQKITGLKTPPRDIENVPAFSIGGPVVIPHIYDGHNKTFFFGGAQWDREFGNASFTITVPTDAGVTTLQSLAASCPNAALYLKALGSLRGVSSASNISIAAPAGSTTCNGSLRTGQNVQVGQVSRVSANAVLDNNDQVRVDHIVSDKQTLSFRWLWDRSSFNPGFNNLPGFDNSNAGVAVQAGFADTYVISPRMTNEFRFNYGRLGQDVPLAAPDAFHATLPVYNIAGLIGPNNNTFGGANNIPQFRFANNWQYADNVTMVRGTHTFKFGADILRQLARQHPPFLERGSFTYNASSTATGLANFLDDFGGSSGSVSKLFGNSIYYPNLFRQSYFFQDSWKATRDLTLNLGVRYENYGAPVNIFKIAAFTNYDPVNFATPHKVNQDNNNFAPTVGFAYNPDSRWLGGKRTVIRGGFQTSYDVGFNNLLSNIAGSTPNAVGTTLVSTTSTTQPRGSSNLSGQFAAIAPSVLTKDVAQNNLFNTDMPNPYTNRWSLGIQRELPMNVIFDVSYVGSESHKQYRSIDMNPIVNSATGDRLHPELQVTAATVSVSKRAGEGIRSIRCACANGNYNGLQLEARKAISNTRVGLFGVHTTYTYGHSLDEISDVFGQNSNASSLQSVSQVVGASRHLDYANSDFDYRHNAVVDFTWNIRAPRGGFVGRILGGWQLAGIQRWQSGFPYTIHNGTDRDADGQSGPDRPDIGNFAAPLNTRAIISRTCSTGYANPDATNACVSPSSVHFIEGSGLPTAITVRRNSLRTRATDYLTLNVAKDTPLSERVHMNYALEMFNAPNTVNLTGVPNRTVNGSRSGTFLDLPSSGINSSGRSMIMSLKLVF
jgi:hypothetical protein